jgi:hypothetical protein
MYIIWGIIRSILLSQVLYWSPCILYALLEVLFFLSYSKTSRHVKNIYLGFYLSR